MAPESVGPAMKCPTTSKKRFYPILGAIVLASIAFAHSPLGTWAREFQLERTLAPGHDAFGRNLLALTLSAGGTSLSLALALAIAAVALSLVFTAVAEFAPSRAARAAIDSLLQGASAFPSVLFALGWAAYRGPGWGTLAAALLFSIVPDLTRLLILRTREIRAEPFLEAAIALGAAPWRVSSRHVAPHLFPLLRARAPLLVSRLILGEATLSFLGVGAPLGQDTWGMLLLQSRDYLIEAPGIAVLSGFPLVLLAFALQWLARDDSPKSSESR